MPRLYTVFFSAAPRRCRAATAPCRNLMQASSVASEMVDVAPRGFAELLVHLMAHETIFQTPRKEVPVYYGLHTADD